MGGLRVEGARLRRRGGVGTLYGHLSQKRGFILFIPNIYLVPCGNLLWQLISVVWE